MLLLNFAACSTTLSEQAPSGGRRDEAPREEHRDAAPNAEASEKATATEDVRSVPCEAMTRTACMASRACELELSPREDGERSGQYVCRPAAGRCEEDLAQSELLRGSSQAEAEVSMKACTDRPGCSLRKSDCYCRCRGAGRTTIEDGAEADDCDCYCAGGAPVACVSTSAGGS